MKKLITGILCYALLPCLAMAQTMKNFDANALIVPYHIQITDLKTTVILFPNPIKSVDRGSRFVLAEKVKDAENVLKIKAQRPGLPESNLSVITADGKLYSFIVDDTANLPYQAIDLRKQEKQEKDAIRFADAGLNDIEVRDISAHITILPAFLHHKDKADDMKMELEGIYMDKDVMFYEFKISNKSHIDYSVDFTRFYVRDKKKVKRMAIQEQEITPLQTYPDSAVTIAGNNRRTIVLAFKKFTIADNKNLAIELYEKNGDRHLSMNLDGKEILKARPVVK
jgi:conjugative transposon TraN protein